MARATHVKKARKDIPGTDIKAGDSYYWWKFRFGGKHVSKTPPKPSQLTQSEFMSQYLAFQENWSRGDDKDDVVQDFRSLAEEVRALGEEQSGKLSNMPEGLQEGDTGQLLQSRADSCEETAQALDEAADELEAYEPEEAADTDDDDETAEVLEEQDTWEEKADELWEGIDWSAE